MKRRLLLPLAGFAIAFGLSAETFQYQGLWFSRIDDSNECEIVMPEDMNIKYSGEVTIPSVANGLSVTGIDSDAFSYCPELTAVNIPATVTTIEMPAFSSSPNLAAINVAEGSTTYASVDGVLYNKEQSTLIAVPGTTTELILKPNVTAIGPWAAGYNEKLTNISYDPQKNGLLIVTEIGEYAFVGTSVERIYAAQTTTIGAGAFQSCRQLTSITLPSLEAIPHNLCYDCSSLQTIGFGPTKSIGNQAFSYCPKLTRILFDNVETIGYQAFSGCTGIFFLNFGKNVSTIGSEAFRGCTGIQSVRMLPQTPPANAAADAFKDALAPGCILFTENPEAYQQTAPWNSYGFTIMSNSFTTADARYQIYYDAPQYCILVNYLNEAATSATVGGTVSYSQHTFEVRGLGGRAFYNLPNLQEVNVLEPITAINSGTFESCSALSTVNLPEGLENIGREAFCDCNALTEINLPVSVRTATGIAKNCNSLISINIPEGNEHLYSVDGLLYAKQTDGDEYRALVSVPSGLESVTVPEGTTYIYDYADISTKLKAIDLPVSLGNFSFRYCPALVSVSMRASTPPMTGPWLAVFAEEVYTNGTLYVPLGCADNYRTAFGGDQNLPWAHFAHIEERDFSGIETVVAAPAVSITVSAGRIVVEGAAKLSIHDLSGRTLYSGATADMPGLPSGIYIVRAGDATAKVAL